MAATVMGGFLDRVRTAVGPADDPRTDAQLLAAFDTGRDAGAFAVLVGRYGALVWAVCRRVTGNPDAAEDVFQATFLVLARKARAVRPRQSAGGWLHRTATHIALKARAMTDRRRLLVAPAAGPEPAAPDPPERPDPATLAALDEEIARLPDGLRTAVVLCELHGTPRREAAVRLGIAEGTLSSRLAAARKRLADRLRRRGVAPAGGVAGLLAAGRPADAGPPPGLVAAAAAFGGGTGPPVPAAVSALAQGEIRTMFLNTLVSMAGAVVLLAAAAGLWPMTTPAAPATTQPPAAAPAKALAGVIVLTSFPPGPPIELVTPDGTAAGRPAVGAAAYPVKVGEPPHCPLWLPRFSPDGKRLAAIRLGPIVADSGPWTQNHLWVFDLAPAGGPPVAVATELRWPSAVWSPDGTKLYGSSVDPEKTARSMEEGTPVPLLSWVYDLTAKKKVTLAVPPDHAVTDISPDGKTLLTVVTDSANIGLRQSYLVPLDTLRPRQLTAGPFRGLRFSPDGRQVLGNRAGQNDQPSLPLAAVSVADGSLRPIPLAGGAVWARDACWSPDGGRIAYVWCEVAAGLADPPAGQPRPLTHRVTVADADGRNARVIVRREHGQDIVGLDWR